MRACLRARLRSGGSAISRLGRVAAAGFKTGGVLLVGNTGAGMAAALFTLGRIKGVNRPAISAAIPHLKGHPIRDAPVLGVLLGRRNGILVKVKAIDVDQWVGLGDGNTRPAVPASNIGHASSGVG